MKHLHKRLDKIPLPDPDAPEYVTLSVDRTQGPPPVVTHYAARGDTLREITQDEYEEYAACGVPEPTEIHVNLLDNANDQ